MKTAPKTRSDSRAKMQPAMAFAGAVGPGLPVNKLEKSTDGLSEIKTETYLPPVFGQTLSNSLATLPGEPGKSQRKDEKTNGVGW